MVKYFSLPNLSATVLETMPAPYNNPLSYPAEFMDGTDHDAFRKWRAAPSTKHQFFSLCEGVNSHQRISEKSNADDSNDIRRIYGIVLDYDCHGHDMAWGVGSIKNVPVELQPSWMSLTYRRGFRLVWEFEESILCPTNEVFNEFFRLFCEVTRAHLIMPGLDVEAGRKCTMFYERGREWRKVSDAHFNQTLVEGLMMKASEAATWKAGIGEPSIEDIASLVARKYPNKWEGEFKEGARGCRFWDATADNKTAAIVRRSGMQCFTGEVPFRSWASIFGPATIQALTAESTARVVNDFYYDGKVYIAYSVQRTSFRFIHKTEEFLRYLREYYHVPKDRLAEVHAKIEEERRIDLAVPLPFLNPGVHYDSQGNKVLNISQLKLMQPSFETNLEWGQGFPKLADYLDQLLKAVSPAQLSHFLAYLSHFYKACYEHRKTKGQVTFIAGPPGAGKSFLVNAVLGKIFSGVTPAGSYLVDQDQYNDHLFKSNVWVLDDEMGNTDPKAVARYTNMLKQIAANHNLRYRPMFSSGGVIEWFGRLFVTLNEDYKSLEILPDMDVNNRDKVNFYRCGPTKVDFMVLSHVFSSEAPFFCRYLLEYKTDPAIVDSRFGVKSYHEGEVKKKTDVGGRTSTDIELFENFRSTLFSRDEHCKKDYVVMTPLMIFSFVQQDPILKDLTQKSHWSQVHKLARMLFSLEKELPYVRSFIPKAGGRAYFVVLSPDKKNLDRETTFAKSRLEVEKMVSMT